MEERYFPIADKVTGTKTGDSFINAGNPTNYAVTSVLRRGTEAKETRDGVDYYDLEEVFLAWDTNIPAGSTVTKAKITYTAAETHATDVYSSVYPLDGGAWSSGVVVDPIITSMPHTAEISDTASASLGSEGVATDITLYVGHSLTGGTSFAQVVEIDSLGNGTLGSASMKMQHVGSSWETSSGVVWLEIWSVSGSAGAYVTDTLLAESEQIPWDSIGASTTFRFLDTTGPWGGNDNAIATSALGARCIVKFRTNVELSSSIYMQAKADSTATATTNNAIRYGSFTGFSRMLYGTRDDLEAIGLGTQAAGITHQAETAETQYVWGDSGYSPDLTTTGIRLVAQACIDADGYTGAVGMFIADNAIYPTPADSFRVWHSSDATGQDGPVLTVEWTTPVGDATSVSSEVLLSAAVSSAISAQPILDYGISIASAFSSRSTIQ